MVVQWSKTAATGDGMARNFSDRGISPGFSKFFPAMDRTEGVIAWSGLVSGSKGNCLDVVSWSEVFGTARMEASKLATHQLPSVVFLHSKISVTAGFDGVGSRPGLGQGTLVFTKEVSTWLGTDGVGWKSHRKLVGKPAK